MKEKITTLLKDAFILRLIKLTSFIFLFFLLVGIWKWGALPLQLPLFYSLPRSPEQLGTPLLLLLLPFFPFFFFVLDFLIASYLYPYEKLAAYLLLIIGTIVSLLFFITFIKIIFLIT